MLSWNTDRPLVLCQQEEGEVTGVARSTHALSVCTSNRTLTKCCTGHWVITLTRFWNEM